MTDHMAEQIYEMTGTYPSADNNGQQDDAPGPERDAADERYDASEVELTAEEIKLFDAIMPPLPAVTVTRWKFAALWNTAGEDPRLTEPVPKGRTRAIWRQRDGTRIRVVDMTDRHLLNTIAVLKTMSELARMREIMQIGHYVDNAPEHAADAAEEGMREICDSADPAEYFKIYKQLVRDARARGLTVEYDAVPNFSPENEWKR